MPDVSPDVSTASLAQQDTAASEPVRAQPAPGPMPQPEQSRTEHVMIDVHPAHHAATTWRDFFIHIATICLGLLIAIGLEQAVEAVHHAGEHRELVADMRDEASRNVVTLGHSIDIQIDRATWELAAMKALETAAPHAGVVTVTLPGHGPGAESTTGERAVWAIAQANGKAALLTEQEAETYHRLDFEAEDAVEARRRYMSVGNDMRAEEAHLRIHLLPGGTVAVPVAELSALLKDMAADVGAENAWVVREAVWAGAADAVAKGEQGQALFDSMATESNAIRSRLRSEF